MQHDTNSPSLGTCANGQALLANKVILARKVWAETCIYNVKVFAQEENHTDLMGHQAILGCEE